MSNLTWVIGGAGKKGNLTPVAKYSNMGKTALTESVAFADQTTTSSGYERRGQNYKGFIFITDSTYTGEPIVDATKLSQFFSWSGMTAGW